jgi:2-hydroxy-3-keto-5-methylthiopentenyl-1-phosphate phosphatase
MKLRISVFISFDVLVTGEPARSSDTRLFASAVCATVPSGDKLYETDACDRARTAVNKLGRFPLSELEKLIDETPIDLSFAPFAGFCREYGISLYLISDGWDFALRRMLRRHGLTDVRVFANEVSLSEEDQAGRVVAGVTFPFDDAECRRCSCCKRNIMLTSTADQDILCYVGGSCDEECPARFADIVFARGGLQAYCQRENISYYPYASLCDVHARLRSIIERAGVHSRRRARLERRAAFMQES